MLHSIRATGLHGFQARPMVRQCRQWKWGKSSAEGAEGVGRHTFSGNLLSDIGPAYFGPV